ncbi:MAG: hypothetical protein IPI43_01750 [Sandaracinaceae bacterium]|nr:hypothetical protein [Sandaracinaceae bacterium]
MPPPDGPESHCYDAVEPRAFTWDTFSQLAVLRSLEVEYSYFDSNPACAATCIVGTQSFEEFLSRGAGTTVPDAVHAQVRDYLLSQRTPGSSTWVSVDFGSLVGLGAPSAEQPCAVWWGFLVEDTEGAHPGFPGPSYAGFFDEQPGAERGTLRRLLVIPGERTVVANVSVRYPVASPTQGVAFVTLRATANVPVTAGQHVPLRCEVDLAGRSATLVDDGAKVARTVS